MLGTYSESVAPGTLVNRMTQAKTFITFAVHYGVDPLAPTPTDLCMYLQFLKNSFSAPTSVKNYLSGAKTWILEHGGLTTSFASFEYGQMIAGLTKRSSHVPARAAPLNWAHIRMIALFCDETPSVPAAAKPCVLIGFYTFLRSGNLLSPTMSSWGGPHTITPLDLKVSDAGLQVTIRSTKTKSSPTPVSTILPWQEDPLLCPVSAWLKYQHRVKPWILGPAFLCDSGLPLTSRHLVGFMRLALRGCKDIDPANVSMHSLRRGAVQTAVASGTELSNIKQMGMWTSDSGIAPYLK